MNTPRTLPFVLFVLLFACDLLAQEPPDATQICPLTLVIEKGDSPCPPCGEDDFCFPREQYAGKTLRLLNTSKVEIKRLYGDAIYQCNCDYAVVEEDREILDCRNGGLIKPNGLSDPFGKVLLFRWIEPPLNEADNVCSNFRFEYGYDTMPFLDQNDFDMFNGSIQFSFNGRSSQERAVVMASPWNDTRFFSEEYLFETPEVQAAYDRVLARSVDYSCRAIANPTPTFFDLNPLFAESFETLDAIKSVNSPLALEGKLSKVVNGTVADGVSEILVVIPAMEESTLHLDVLTSSLGSMTFPWGQDEYRFGGGDFFVGIYHPPEAYPESLEQEKFAGVNFVQIPIEIEVTTAEDTLVAEIQIPLIRPPVVLVHGTFDDPKNCWKTGLSASGNGLFQELERAGYKVFTCDYSNTNGSQKSGSCGSFFGTSAVNDGININRRISSFECNKRVVYENPGGIKDAVDFYRDSLVVACTQADAIGHSMGGVLIRVYASDRRRENIISYETDYYRNDNFEEGDINRIITMASTHHGSDVAWLLDRWSKIDQARLSEDFKFTEPLQLGVGVAGWWIGGQSEFTGAVQDQVPQSRALQRIGPTRIPAHAMTFYIDDIEDVKNDQGDWEEQFYYKRIFQVGMALYFLESVTDQLLTAIALEWQRLPDRLKKTEDRFYKSYSTEFLDSMTSDFQKFRDLYKAPLEQNFDVMYALADFVNTNLEGFTAKEVSVLQYETAESSINDFDNDEHQNFIDRRYDLFEDEYQETLDLRDFEELEELMNKYRFLVFKNDWNDGTVRFLSQTGSLEDTPYYSRFEQHLHSYAPRYPDAMRRVIELLKGGMSEFASDGFPNAGRKLPIWLPDVTEEADPDVTGCEAACWSGMVPDHAMAWARVADRENAIVLNRPVNPDATPLINNNAATKGMNLKGKSSDWGPQKGLIAVDQRFSKIWNLYSGEERDEQIAKFSKKVKALLEDEPAVAEKRQLTKQYDCTFIRDDNEFIGWVTPAGADATEEIRFTAKSNMNEVYTWFDAQDDGCELVPCESQCNVSELQPFYVLANPDPELAELNGGESPVYTADYDLLAIGFFDRAAFNNPDFAYRRPTYSPPEDFFDCDIGVMFDEQQDLLQELNLAVSELGYTGGNVAHHGPENQFTNMEFSRFPCSSEMGPLSITANPYFDYPITAFEPDDERGPSAGIVRTIQMGPPGYKDINLKRYIAEKRRQGFDLIANPNSPSWQWEYWRPYSYNEGFDDRDYVDLPAYPEELPRPDLEKCLRKYGCLDRRPVAGGAGQVIDYAVRFKAKDIFKIYPNPLGNEPLRIIVKSNDPQIALLRLTDGHGRVLTERKLSLNPGINRFTLDTQAVPKGLYFVSITGGRQQHSQKLLIQK